MPKEEFERDLEEYLKARKRAASIDLKGLLNRIVPKRKELSEQPKVEMPEEVEVYEERKEEKPSLFSLFKQSGVAKLFKREPASNEELLQAQMQAEDAAADMKEVAKITLGMIRQLPDEHLRQFKSSPDFEKLKTILKKHELIK